MIEAVKFWNEPNNKSHWAFELDPEWNIYSEMVKLTAAAVKAENPGLIRVLGGISPIDPGFIIKLQDKYTQVAIPLLTLAVFLTLSTAKSCSPLLPLSPNTSQ